MNYKFLLLLSLTCLIHVNEIKTQPWLLLDRQQKDSVIFNHTNKGNKYIGTGIGFSIGGGYRNLLGIKVEPSYGIFVRKNHLIAGRVIFEFYNTQVDNEYKTSTQITFGGFYRYYLPERKVISPLFAQAGIYTGKMWGWKNVDSVYSKTNFYVLNAIVGFGIAFPINKFTLELGMNYEYQFINRKMYDLYWGGKLFGILCFSYIF